MRYVARIGPPSTDRDSRGPAQVVALTALVAGVTLMVYGIVDDSARTAFVGGAALATFGGLLALLGPGLFAPDATTRRRFAQVAVPAFVVAVVCPAVAVLASAGLGDRASANTNAHAGHAAAVTPPAAADGAAIGAQIANALHDHPTTVAPPAESTAVEASATPDEVPTTAAAATPAAALSNAITSEHLHGTATPEQPLDRETRAQLGVQLTAARAAAMSYPTVADAERAGYAKVTGYLPLIGAHYVNWDLMDGTFDVDHPEMLLYDGTSPDSRIVGLSYYVFSPGEPAGFAGPNDHWHQHIGLCLRDGVVVGGTQLTAEQCAARGGAKAQASDGWMVHAWVVPGWESPAGVFSPEHPGLT
jgi:hypothetical protein